MRNYALAAIVGLAGLAVGGALIVLSHHAPPAPAPVAALAPSPALGAAEVSLPPAPMPEAAAPPSVAAGAAPSEAAAVPAPAPPAVPAAPDLPTVDVAPLAVHTVPNDDTAAPTVTLQDRDGRTIKEIKPSPGLSPGYVPSVGPGGARSFASTATPSYAGTASGPLMVPPVGGSRLAMAPSTAFFNGTAQPAGGTTLSVGGRFLSLFGIRVADPRDQCGLGPGDNRSCADVARDALAQRLARYPSVSCHVPPGQRGQPGAVCTDASGTDLGGFLVAEGYALADTSRSYDYFGAEGVARSYRRGLWRYR